MGRRERNGGGVVGRRRVNVVDVGPDPGERWEVRVRRDTDRQVSPDRV